MLWHELFGVRMTRPRWIAIAAILASLLAAAAGSLAIVDHLHPGNRIVSGARIWHCALVGGSWPVDADGFVKLRSGLTIGEIGAVNKSGAWVSVVSLVDSTGHAAGEAAFVLGDGAGSRLGGIDRRAAAVANVISSEGIGSNRKKVAAARECLRRRLPLA